MQRPDLSRRLNVCLAVCLAACLGALPVPSASAQSPFTDPDEGGIGGTGHHPGRIEIPERPDLPEVPDLPERIELPDSPSEALDTNSGVTPPDLPDSPERPSGDR
jgi:hypothetical protein